MAKEISKKKIALGVGAGVAGVAALAAGYYFFGATKAATNRKKAAKWATDLKADVVKHAKKMKAMDQKAYHAIVDEATKAYKTMKSIDAKDLAAAAAELKSNWDHLHAEVSRVAKKKSVVAKKAVAKAVKTVKKAVAKKVAVKKAVKKVAKKKN